MKLKSIVRNWIRSFPHQQSVCGQLVVVRVSYVPTVPIGPWRSTVLYCQVEYPAMRAWEITRWQRQWRPRERGEWEDGKK